MTKKQKVLRSILYPLGVATLIYLALFSFYWWFCYPGNLSSLLAWGSLFTTGCIGVAIVGFILKDDITQYLPFLKRKPPRITIYTLSVISSICLFHYTGIFPMTNPPYTFFGNGDSLSIALGLTGTFTAGFIGFAIISLILRDYAKQPLPFIKHEPLFLLLIVSYFLAAIGGVSLVYLLRLALLIVVIGMIPALVFGGCIGLASVKLAFRDDITFPSLRNKPLRITLYLLITVNSFLSVFLFGVGSAVFLGPSPYELAFSLILLPVIFGSVGFIAATILLRGNIERNLSIAGKIIGVCLMIALGGVLAAQLGVP